MAKAKHNKLSSNIKKAVEQKFKEYDHKLEALSKINVPKAIEESVQAKIMNEIKKQLPSHMPKAVVDFVKPRLDETVLSVMKNNQIKLFTSSSTTTANLSKMELKIELYNRMYENRSFGTNDTHQQLHNILWDSILLDQESLDAQERKPTLKKRPYDNQDPPNDREGEKSRRRRNVSNIDQDEDGILRLSTVMVAKKIKELIKKDELTIADLEGAGLEMLKSRYKNDVELEYHIDKIRATMSEEAKWSEGEDDLTKP
ncbi:hypothetical protein Tco_1460247 [Tanacetum coccineum]